MTNSSCRLRFFYRLHQSSGDPRKAQFLEPHIREFFTDVSTALAQRSWLRLATLKLDDVIIAAVLAFDRGSTVSLYNSGFDPEYRFASPGIELIALELKSAIERGRTYYDFMRGDEAYKYDFGAHDRFVWRLSLGDARQGSVDQASDHQASGEQLPAEGSLQA